MKMAHVIPIYNVDISRSEENSHAPISLTLQQVHMMATSDKEIQITDCPVCHEKYSNPKILPCAHLMCRDCLVSWMKTKVDALCPLCRSDIVDPKRSNIKNWDVFVDSLPTDHAMSAIVESLKIFSEKHVCHVHNNVNALSLCLHCNVKLCQGCIEVHRKLPSTRSHKVEDLATLTPKRLAASRQTPCSVHPDKTAELVCVDHNVLICQLCATVKHRACSEVTNVLKVSGRYKQSLLEMENKLNAVESTLNQAITELEERLFKSEKSTNTALKDIDTTCDSLLKSVETCRKRLKKLVTEENDKMKAAVHEQKSIISHKRVRVTSHQGLIRRVLQMENSEPLVAMIINLEGRVSELATPFPQDTNSCLTVTLKFDTGAISLVDEKLQKIIQPIFNFTCGTEKNTWMSHNNSGRNIILSNNGRTAEVKDKMALNRVLISREPKSTNKLYEPLQNTWMFHNICGSNIVLSSNGQTAEVKNIGRLNGLLISREPMSTNKLYEILVEETGVPFNGGFYLAIGVCEENPLPRTLPPVYFKMKTFVGVHAIGGIRHGEWTKEYSCPALKTVKAGSRLGVMVDTSHSLYVYVDGKDQGVKAKNVAQPCYAMFDLHCFIKKASTLPVSSIQ